MLKTYRKSKQKSSITYSSFVFPREKSLDMDLLNADSFVEKIVAGLVGKSDAVAIALNPGFPVWFYLLVYNKVSCVFPEVAVEVSSGEFLVTRTIFRSLEFSRPENFHLLDEYFNFPITYDKSKVNLNVDLSELPEVNMKSIGEFVSGIREENPFCRKLTLTGDCPQSSALVFYALVSQYCGSIFYESSDFNLRLI